MLMLQFPHERIIELVIGQSFYFVETSNLISTITLKYAENATSTSFFKSPIHLSIFVLRKNEDQPVFP